MLRRIFLALVVASVAVQRGMTLSDAKPSIQHDEMQSKKDTKTPEHKFTSQISLVNGAMKSHFNNGTHTFTGTDTTIQAENGRYLFDPCTDEEITIPPSSSFVSNMLDRHRFFNIANDMLLKPGYIVRIPLGVDNAFSAICKNAQLKLLETISFTIKKEIPLKELMFTSKGRLIDMRSGEVLLQLTRNQFIHMVDGKFTTDPVKTNGPKPRMSMKADL